MRALKKLTDLILALNSLMHSFPLNSFPSPFCNIELILVRNVLSLRLFASLTFGCEFHEPRHLWTRCLPWRYSADNVNKRISVCSVNWKARFRTLKILLLEHKLLGDYRRLSKLRETVSSTGALLSIPVSFTENTGLRLADHNTTFKVRWFPLKLTSLKEQKAVGSHTNKELLCFAFWHEVLCLG